MIAGALGLMNIGQKEDPDFTFRVMVVQVAWPGASLTEMQDQVVNKIERKLQETPHLDFVRSFTRRRQRHHHGLRSRATRSAVT